MSVLLCAKHDLPMTVDALGPFCASCQVDEWLEQGKATT